MGRSRRFLARVLAVTSLVAVHVVSASPAHACSCARIDLERSLEESDGAFVGTYVARHALSDQRFTVTFDVEQVVKGEFGPSAVVLTNDTAGPCGIERLNGPRMGLFLERGGDGVWVSGLCQQVPPDELLAFAPNSHPPDPSVEAIDPAVFPWWSWVLPGLAVVGVAFAFIRSRRRARDVAPSSSFT